MYEIHGPRSVSLVGEILEVCPCQMRGSTAIVFVGFVS